MFFHPEDGGNQDKTLYHEKKDGVIQGTEITMNHRFPENKTKQN
jgi:hypothetical protein